MALGESHSNCGFHQVAVMQLFEFPNKRGQLAGHQITFKQNPRLVLMISKMDLKEYIFRIRPVVRSDCTAGTINAAWENMLEGSGGRGRKPSGIGVAECLLSTLLKGDAWVVCQETQRDLPSVCALQTA